MQTQSSLAHLISFPPFDPLAPLTSGLSTSSLLFMAAAASSSLSLTGSYASSDISDMPKNADYYLPPIVRSLGEDVIVNKVRLQCKAITDGRYLYTYTMDLAQDHPQGLRTDRSIDMIDESTVSSKQTGRTRDASSFTDTAASSNYSIQSYHVRRPEPASVTYSVRRPEPAPIQPQTTVSVRKPAISLTDVTLHSGAEENSAEIRQEVTVTFYLFGQSDKGDYFRLRLFDAFLGKTSLRRVLRSFGAATQCDFKEFLDHLYVMPGNGDMLKDVTKWKKLSRDSISMTIRDLRFNGSPFADEFVLIADLIGVHGMAPAVRRAIGKK